MWERYQRASAEPTSHLPLPALLPRSSLSTLSPTSPYHTHAHLTTVRMILVSLLEDEINGMEPMQFVTAETILQPPAPN